MPRLATVSGAPQFSVLLAVCAVLGCARNSSACTMSLYSPFLHPDYTVAASPAGADVGDYGRVVILGGFQPSFPCTYLVGAREHWVTVVGKPNATIESSLMGVTDAPLSGTLPAVFGSVGLDLNFSVNPNPRCADRTTTIYVFRNWLGGPLPTIILVTVNQAGRLRVPQSDGAMKCEPDTTGERHKFTIKTKSAVLGVRG